MEKKHSHKNPKIIEDFECVLEKILDELKRVNESLVIPNTDRCRSFGLNRQSILH